LCEPDFLASSDRAIGRGRGAVGDWLSAPQPPGSANPDAQSGDNRTMGDKWIVPYGLYRAHGFASAHLAQRTGFSEEDFTLLCRGLTEMFDHDRSASRGEMACRGLYVFRQDNPLGNAPAHRLFERIKVGKKESIPRDQPPRAFADYEVKIERDGMPAGGQALPLFETFHS
jgi:CRISPR-associated protein Csd2